MRDAPRLVRNRLAFFRGEVPRAAGKDLLYRILASEPELTLLQEIESQFEPTFYTAKPGCHVDFLTDEACRQIHLIFNELGLNKDAENAGNDLSRQTSHQDSKSIGGGERKRARIE